MVHHTIGYIIETDDDVRVEYVESSFTPYPAITWVNGVNSFSDISSVDPNSADSPSIVKAGGSLYRKTVFVPWTLTSLRLSILIDGVEGNGSFRYDGYNTFIKSRKSSSDIYTTILKNTGRDSRYGSLTITHQSDESSYAVLDIVQSECDLSLKILSCTVSDIDNESEIPILDNYFEYQFDTLIDRNDKTRETLKFDIEATGVHNRWYLKSIKEYSEIGQIDDSYKYSNGKFYRRRQKFNGNSLVTYYTEAMVIDNVGYQLKKYDGALDVSVGDDSTLTVVNHGRVFMEKNAFYLITIANYDDIDTICQIKLTYANNPINFGVL